MKSLLHNFIYKIPKNDDMFKESCSNVFNNLFFHTAIPMYIPVCVFIVETKHKLKNGI